MIKRLNTQNSSQVNAEEVQLLQPCMLALYSYDFASRLKPTPFKKDHLRSSSKTTIRTETIKTDDDSCISERSLTPKKGILKKKGKYNKRAFDWKEINMSCAGSLIFWKISTEGSFYLFFLL